MPIVESAGSERMSRRSPTISMTFVTCLVWREALRWRVHSTSQADRRLRIAGLAACLIAGLPSVLQLLALGAVGALDAAQISGLPAALVRTAYLVMVVGQIAGVVAFAATFWWATGPTRLASRPWAGIGLLATQVVLALVIETDFLVIVAVQVPFLLPERWACGWLLGQLLATAALVTATWAGGTLVLLEGISALSREASAALTGVSLMAWQMFAFAVGSMACTERRVGRELARAYAEQRVTNDLLADGSRTAERLRMSRELHDTLGHHLTVLSVNLELAGHVATERAEAPVRRAQEVTAVLLADLRRVVGDSRDDQPLDLRGALQRLVDGVPPPQIHLTYDAELRIEERAIALVIVRCVQEAVTNAVRHAQAANLYIDITERDRGVEIVARDDGGGFHTLTPGHGLIGMRERVEEVEGTIDVTTSPGHGVTVRVWMPVRGSTA